MGRMFGGDFGLPPGPRYLSGAPRRGAPPVVYLKSKVKSILRLYCHAVAPRRCLVNGQRQITHTRQQRTLPGTIFYGYTSATRRRAREST